MNYSFEVYAYPLIVVDISNVMEVVLVCFQDYKSTSTIEEHVDIGKIKPCATPVRREGEIRIGFLLLVRCLVVFLRFENMGSCVIKDLK